MIKHGKLHIYSLVIGTLVLILLMTGSMADVSKGVNISNFYSGRS